MKHKDILAGTDVDKLLSNAVKATLSEGKKRAIVDESYVAEQKPFKQVSELVSEKVKNVHTELYKQYVERLNAVSSELDSSDRSQANSKHSDYRSLKLDEAYNLNSVWLHELFFANCFDPHSEITMDSVPYMKLQAAFGNFDDWQKDFIACALSSGQGWAVCGYNMYLRTYVNTFISNHSQDVMVGLFPVIVLDLHEHARIRDYSTDTKSYTIAMMREFNWDVINERFVKAEAIAKVLK